VYVDAAADLAKAAKIVVDAKADYPAACNACETVLFHESVAASGGIYAVLQAMRQAGISCKAGPRAIAMGLFNASDAPPGNNLSLEYGDLTCLVEVVSFGV
jgi:gamma-glutamyl phosphate reductase